MNIELRTTIQNLPCWSGPVEPVPLHGGITNFNFTVQDQGKKFLVRLGQDIIHHQIMRFNELAASKAASMAGIAPRVFYADQQALVIGFVQGKTLNKEDIQKRLTLERIIPVLKTCHQDLKNHLRGPVLSFWVFHIIRDYAHTLYDNQSRLQAELPRLLKSAGELEEAVSPINIVFGHNDLLAENFIDDGDKIWLIDWEYGGFNSPLFDIGGLCSNCGLSSEDEEYLLENYFEHPVQDELRYRFQAMKVASLLRETMWSMVSEIYSDIDFDYQSYSEANLAAFDQSYEQFKQM